MKMVHVYAKSSALYNIQTDHVNLCKCLKGHMPSNIICYVYRSTESNFDEEGLSDVKSQSRDEPEQNIEESLLLFDEKEKEQACIPSEPTQTQISSTQKKSSSQDSADFCLWSENWPRRRGSTINFSKSLIPEMEKVHSDLVAKMRIQIIQVTYATIAHYPAPYDPQNPHFPV